MVLKWIYTTVARYLQLTLGPTALSPK
jgi:hypothetical protein